MENFEMQMQIRWADIDANFHLRHSVYYDWGSLCRMTFLNKAGFTLAMMRQFHVSPILFREECVFKREIGLTDIVTIDMKISKAKKDFSRFSVQHAIKKDPGTLSAILTVDVAWINGLTRKLAVLPEEAIELLNKFPVSEDFQWL